MKNYLLLLCVIGFMGVASYADESTPAGVVQQFYAFHFAHDMGFTPDAVRLRSAWMSPEMIESCRVYFAIPQNPDEPPFIDGDPFTGTQEYPESFSVGEAKSENSSARVDVTFQWKEAPSRKATILLKKVDNRWLIDDIEFPNQPSFRKLLASAN